MFAVIKTGGKQYRIAANDVVRVEKISGQPGDIVELGQVLLLSGENGMLIGNPYLQGVTIAAEVLRQEKSDTVIIFKKRRRHHYRRRNGHRQALTALKITEILTDGRKPQARKAAKPAPQAKRAEASAVEKAPAVEPASAAHAPPEAKAAAKSTKKPAGTAKPKSTGKAKPKSK